MWRRNFFLFFPLQAVTVKEALAVKGRHLRRSISTPNVQHVMNTHTSLTALLTEAHGKDCFKIRWHWWHFFFSLSSLHAAKQIWLAVRMKTVRWVTKQYCSLSASLTVIQLKKKAPSVTCLTLPSSNWQICAIYIYVCMYFHFLGPLWSCGRLQLQSPGRLPLQHTHQKQGEPR